MNTFEKTIKAYIDKVAQEDAVSASKYEAKKKDIEGCCKYIIVEVRKSGRQGFADEGEAMNHCVFSNRYYSKESSLIIGARVNGKRTETIEVSMKDWTIVQCRGKHNQSSKHHERIMEVMTANMDKFRRMAQ